MEIKVKDGDVEIVLSDERLDNDNFVEVTLKDEISGEVVRGEFMLSDLMPALIAFDVKRSRRMSDEQPAPTQ